MAVVRRILPLLALTPIALGGCVAAVPAAAPTLTVIPGQGKTAENLQADDAYCRGAPPARTAGATATATTAPAVTADQYYACMTQRGEQVVQEVPQAYPAGYAPAYPATYAYPAYAGYPYPYYPYGYGYGYPYVGPYVGFGIGFGYGRFYGGRGWGGGWHGGGWGGGWHGGGWGGGWHGGGGWHR